MSRVEGARCGREDCGGRSSDEANGGARCVMHDIGSRPCCQASACAPLRDAPAKTCRIRDRIGFSFSVAL